MIWENDDPNTEEREWILCTKAACNDDDPNTNCSCGLDYDCISTTDGFSHCGRYEFEGWCGTPVDLLKPEQWDSVTGVDDAYTCNEVDATLLCDDRPFRNEGVDAQLNCVSISSTSNEGVCMAFCEVPADPAELNPDPFSGACPEDLVCSNELGLTMVFGPWVDNTGFSSRADATECDPVLCPEGLPCETCGEDAYCGTVPGLVAGTTESLCFMPYSFCQAADEPTDPVTSVDAGNDDSVAPTVDSGNGGIVEDVLDAGGDDLTDDVVDSGSADNTAPVLDAGENETAEAILDAGFEDVVTVFTDAGEQAEEAAVSDAGNTAANTMTEDAGL